MHKWSLARVSSQVSVVAIVEGIGVIEVVEAHPVHVLAQTAFTSSFPIPLLTEVQHAFVWISVEQLH